MGQCRRNLATYRGYRKGLPSKRRNVAETLWEGVSNGRSFTDCNVIKWLSCLDAPGRECGQDATHEYLKVLADHVPQDKFPLYFYDQLGSVYSDQPDDHSLWTIERFRSEVRQALGLER